MSKPKQALRWTTQNLVDLLDDETRREFGVSSGDTREVWELQGHGGGEALTMDFPGEDAFLYLNAVDLHQFTIELFEIVHQAVVKGEKLKLVSDTLGLCYVFRVPTPIPAFIINAAKLFESTDRKIDRGCQLSEPESFNDLRLSDAYLLGLLKGELNEFATSIGMQRIQVREEVAEQRAAALKGNDKQQLIRELKHQSKLLPGKGRKTLIITRASHSLKMSPRTMRTRIKDLGINDSDWLPAIP